MLSSIAIAALLTGCDLAGHCTYVAQVPDMPVTVQAGEENVFHQQYKFSLPEPMRCTFALDDIGLDNGDRVEADIGLRTASNYHVFWRAWHRHVNSSYEAKWPHYIDVTAKDFVMVAIGRVVAPNSETGKWTARFHFGVELSCISISPAPPAPAPEKKADEYIPWSDRQQWADKVENAYSVWRGDRDLSFLLAHSKVVADLHLNPGEISLDISTLANAHNQQEALVYRILNERHRDFEDRCQVRRDVANEMIRHLTEDINPIYESYKRRAADQGVVWGVSFDSFQGFIQTGAYDRWIAGRQ